jgi:hypothetical protein
VIQNKGKLDTLCISECGHFDPTYFLDDCVFHKNIALKLTSKVNRSELEQVFSHRPQLFIFQEHAEKLFFTRKK